MTSKVNPQILEMGKWAFMTHDTPLYKGLSQVNQLSDFVGRYVLYKHLTSRKNNPLSKEDAVQKASDVFVNYDIAMHPGMQYLDDHGFMMFTKYFLRIQKVLLRLTRDNPLRVLLGVALHNQFSSLPMPMNSSMLARVGNNPFSDGALKFPGTVDETLPIQGLKMLF